MKNIEYRVMMKKLGTTDEFIDKMNHTIGLFSELKSLKEERNEQDKISSILYLLAIGVGVVLYALTFKKIDSFVSAILITLAPMVPVWVWEGMKYRALKQKYTALSERSVGYSEAVATWPISMPYSYVTEAEEPFHLRKIATEAFNALKGKGFVYEVDYPLIQTSALPHGLTLLEYFVFEVKGQKFQIAVGENRKEPPSFMLFPVEEEPFISSELSNQEILQLLEIV